MRGHEPDTVAARKSRDRIHRSMNELRALTSNGGSYVSESNFLKEDWQHSYWGPNYLRLASVKKKSSNLFLLALRAYGVSSLLPFTSSLSLSTTFQFASIKSTRHSRDVNSSPDSDKFMVLRTRR